MAIATACAVAFFSPAAATEPQCNTRDQVIKQLREKYGEAPVGLGVTHNGGLVEILSTENGESWSIVVTSPQGMSCLVAAGEGWRSIARIADDRPT